MRKKLHLKGWSEKEIAHAERIFHQAEEKKHPHNRLLEKSLYWFALIAGLIGTGILSFLIAPILVSANETQAHIMSGFFGLFLGFLVIIFVKQLHWMEKNHHLFISIIIPFVGLINFSLMAIKVNEFNRIATIHNYHNPLTIAFLFFAGFLIPYLCFLIIKRSK
jgi:hypothetical protein